jgi:purine-binding chemotaxis protein CheW
MERQFCSFVVEGFLFGVEVSEVQEVLSHQTMTAVPLAPPAVGGLINLRGQIVTAIDLRTRLGLPARDEQLPMNVVVRCAEDVASLLVDEIGDVVTVTEDRFERPPETLEGVARELITGTYKLDDRLLLVLDIARALEVPATV